MINKVLYSFVVFSILGFGLYTASNFQNQKIIDKCLNESSSEGSISSCIEYHQSLDS